MASLASRIKDLIAKDPEVIKPLVKATDITKLNW